jgi:hypothetical protein
MAFVHRNNCDPTTPAELRFPINLRKPRKASWLCNGGGKGVICGLIWIARRGRWWLRRKRHLEAVVTDYV